MADRRRERTTELRHELATVRADRVARLRVLHHELAAVRADRVARLRERVKQAGAANADDPLPGILLGVLDLLEDDA